MATTISTIYRAEVQVPTELFEKFGNTATYDVRSAQISRKCNVAASGQDSYSDVFEWAEDSSRTCVENFAAEWELYINEMRRANGYDG